MRRKVKLALIENGQKFVGSIDGEKSCLKDANDLMASLDFGSMHCVADSIDYLSPQSRCRSHVAYHDLKYHADIPIYSLVMSELKLGEGSLTEIMTSRLQAVNDKWLSRPLTKIKKIRRESRCAGIAKFEEVCTEKGAELPEYKICVTAADFGLPPDMPCIGMGYSDVLTKREYACAHTKLKVERVFAEWPASHITTCTFDRSYERWSNVHGDYICTVDPNARFWCLRRSPPGEEILRPYTIDEYARCQGFEMHERFTPDQETELIKRLPYRTMCKLLGASYQVNVELVHYIASILALDRIDGKEVRCVHVRHGI